MVKPAKSTELLFIFATSSKLQDKPSEPKSTLYIWFSVAT